ncbi:MAG: porin [Rhizobacter sp.]
MSRSLRAVAFAAASLCASAGAFAQSSVTLYGLMDAGVRSYQTAGTVKNKEVSSGDMTTSFLGFKGAEDLGGGLSAIFTFEHFFRPDVGQAGRFNGDGFWTRSAYVGLKSEYGAVTFGRNTTPFFVSTLVFNAFGDSFSYSPSILHYFQSGGALVGDSGWSNSVAYKSPSFGGASVNLLANLDENGAGQKGNNFGGNVLYFSPMFSGTVAYQNVKNATGGLAAGLDSQESWQLGGAVDFKVVKVFGQYGQVKNEGTVELKNKIFQVGASVPVGNGKALFAYGQAKAESSTTDVTRKTASVGYDYNLSKRTDVYAVYMNDKKTNLDSGNSYGAGIRLTY